jgi:hypothetical protein
LEKKISLVGESPKKVFCRRNCLADVFFLAITPTRASSTYRLVGENTNKGKCYAERDSERERVIPIVLLVKTPTRAETHFCPLGLLCRLKDGKDLVIGCKH